MSSYFHVNGLPKVRHTEETREILNKIEGNKSEFIRDKILEFARLQGFNWRLYYNNGKPEFFNANQWRRYEELEETSKRVDYIYILAYRWLKSLDKFQYANDATLQRLIICG
jgi:hypothetical protein